MIQPTTPSFSPTSEEEQTRPVAGQSPEQLEEMIKGLGGVPIGYTPLPTNVIGQPQGSIWKANFLNNTTIGSFIASPAASKLTGELPSMEEAIAHIPDDLLLTHGDAFIGRPLDDYPMIKKHVRDEMERSQIIASRPWASLGVGFVEGIVDPVSWLPMGALWKNFKLGSGLARTIIESGMTGVAGATVQESVIQRNMLTRSAEESYANIVAGGILGSAIGGLGYGIKGALAPRAKALLESRQRAHQEIVDTLTGVEKKLDENGVLTGEDLANIPDWLRKGMMPTPMNRLLKGPFDTGKWLANAAYQKNMRLEKHLNLDTDGASVETLMRLDKSDAHLMALNVQKIYYESQGISGVFKGTQAKMRGVTKSFDDFESEVWLRLSTEKPSTDTHVNRAADLIRDRYFEPTRQRLEELGVLPEGITPKNAIGYIMQAYLRDKIVETGGRTGLARQFFFDRFKVAQEEIKVFKASPEYREAETKINERREKIKGLPKIEKEKINKQIAEHKKEQNKFERLKAKRPDEEIKKINENIKGVKTKQKDIKETIKAKEKEHVESISTEIKSFKDELSQTNEKLKPIDAQLKAQRAKKQDFQTKRKVLRERIKTKKEGTKAHKDILSEIDRLPLAIAEIEKNISSLDSEKAGVKKTISEIKKDISNLEKVKKLPPEGVPELHEEIKSLETEVKELEKSRRPTPEEVRSHEAEIKKLQRKIDKLEESKKITKKEKESLQKEIGEIEKEILSKAPKRGINSSGKLHAVVDDDVLMTQAEQTIDNILGDTEGKLVNPILRKLQGRSVSPLEERKMSIPQEELMEWSQTSVTKLIEMHNRAVSPIIRLTELAQKNGAEDIPAFQKMLDKMLRDEYNAKTEALSKKTIEIPFRLSNESFFDKKIGSLYLYLYETKVPGKPPNHLEMIFKNEKTVQVKSTQILPEKERKGYAKALYRKAIQESVERGLNFVSDTAVTNEVLSLYRSLEKEGYVFKFNKNIKDETIIITRIKSVSKDGMSTTSQTQSIQGKESTDGLPLVELVSAPTIQKSKLSFLEEISVTPDPKKLQTLRKQLETASSDMNATFELLQGVYGDGPNILNTSAQNFYHNVLKWNYIRLLGHMTLASIADIGLQVFVHGPFRFVRDGVIGAFSEARKVHNRDLAAIGYGIETEMGMRIKSWSDTQGLSVDPGPFTKGLDVATQKFGNLSLMNPWNSWQQRMAGHIGINRTLETIHKFIEGKNVPEKDLQRVIANGLGREHWETIYNYTKDKTTTFNDRTVYTADWTAWDIKTKAQRDALEQFQASVVNEIDSIVIIPGLGDKPLFAQNMTGKFLFQFKTFQMAATNKIMYSGIQRRDDIDMYLGVISMLGMGAASYMLTSIMKGKEPDTSFTKMGMEAVDRSGVVGIYSDIGNVVAKGLGIEGTSRYASRDLVGSFTGPTAGAINEVWGLLTSTRAHLTGEKPLTSNDTEKFKRLFPYQNLFYLDRINQKIFKNLGLALGAEESPER